MYKTSTFGNSVDRRIIRDNESITKEYKIKYKVETETGKSYTYSERDWSLSEAIENVVLAVYRNYKECKESISVEVLNILLTDKSVVEEVKEHKKWTI